MKSVVVFCGSSLGNDVRFEEQAMALGVEIAKRGITLIYGGAKVGLMGAVANGALSGGGNVIGVIPKFLRKKEIVHEGLTKLITVDTMHERKTIMNELCEAAIALPGGFGTIEELFEMLTWGQLGLHKKPIGILNVNGYYDELINLMEGMVDKGFLKKMNQEMMLEDSRIDQLLEKMLNYLPPEVPKWIS